MSCYFQMRKQHFHSTIFHYGLGQWHFCLKLPAALKAFSFLVCVGFVLFFFVGLFLLACLLNLYSCSKLKGTSLFLSMPSCSSITAGQEAQVSSASSTFSFPCNYSPCHLLTPVPLHWEQNKSLLPVSCLDWEFLKALSRPSVHSNWKSMDLGHTHSLHVLRSHLPVPCFWLSGWPEAMPTLPEMQLRDETWMRIRIAAQPLPQSVYCLKLFRQLIIQCGA